MYRVRRMTSDDIPQALEMEHDAFPEQVPPTNFKRELEHRLSRYLVLDDPGDPHAPLPGYAAVWMVIDESHLISIGVRAAERGKGLGELLLIAALTLAIDEGAESMLLEVRVSNTAAQKLYEKYGFKRVGVRRRYYPDNNEDAYLMNAEKLTGEEAQQRLAALIAAHKERFGPYVLALR